MLKLLLPLHKYLHETPLQSSKRAQEDDNNSDEDSDDEDDVAMTGDVVKMLTKYEFLLLLHGMSDILHKLNTLSLVLQRDDVTCRNVMDHVRWFRDGLKVWEKDDDELPISLMMHTRQLLSMVNAAGGVPSESDEELVFDFSNADGASYSFEVTCTKGAHDRAMEALRSYAKNLRAHAKERFLGKEGVIGSLDIFDFGFMPGVDDADFLDYGSKELTILYAHYGKEIDRKGTVFSPIIGDGVFPQWDGLKRKVAAQGFTKEKKESFSNSDAYYFILTDPDCLRSFPDCVLLLKIRMILWLQTATCERGFSARTLIKTKQRTSMGNTLLDILMMVYLNGPELTDDKAVNELLFKTIEAFEMHTKRYPARSSAGILRRTRKPAGIDTRTALQGHPDAIYNDDQDTDEEGEGDVAPLILSKNLPKSSVAPEIEEVPVMTAEDEDEMLRAVPNYQVGKDGGEVLPLAEKKQRTVKWMTRASRKVAIKRFTGWEIGTLTARAKQRWWVRFPRGDGDDSGPMQQFSFELDDQEYGVEGMWLFPAS
jgi:hypothetical protein